MKRKTHFVLLLLILFLAACNPTLPEQKTTSVNLNLTYIPNVQFAPIYVGIEKGFFAEVGLEIKLVYGNEADLIALVGAGKEPFMIASGEQILMARGQGLPVLSVAPWYKDFPVGIVSLKKSGIQEPYALSGKIIGLPGLFGASYIGFEALARAANLNETDYTLRSIGFTQVESLVTGQVDAAVVYVANEPIQLKARGYEVNLIKVSDAADLIGNCLVTNENLLRDDPGIVSAMIDAFQKSLRYVADNPEDSFEICKKYVENLGDLSAEDLEIQRQVLRASIDLWQEEPLDHAAQAQKWQNMMNLLLDLGLMSEKMNTEGVFRDSFSH